MMRALFSGVSGLKVHQTKMDVIGNNIANVNTIGFKSSSVTFSDILYQTTQSASGPNTATGTAGRNAMQIGLGANVASITSNIADSGASQRTDNPFDVMIEGDGFFIVNSGGTNYFTKAGSFYVDALGNLCTATGAMVMGWHVDETDLDSIVQDTVKPLKIMSTENMYTPPKATEAARITGNIDSKDTNLTKAAGVGVNLQFYDNLGHSYTADFAIKQVTSPNVYSVQLKDIKDEKGNSILINKTVGSDGTVTFSAGSYTASFGGVGYTVDTNTGELNASNLATLTFNAANGEFTSIEGSGTGGSASTNSILGLAIAGMEPNAFEDIDIDFSKITMFSSSETSHLEAEKGDEDGNNAGKKAGEMTGISIDTSGKIYGSYDNGDRKLLGQIAVATFANPTGLEAVGNSMYAETQNSGAFNGVGQDPSTGGGGLATGVLEMSTVDLAAQFTDMITTQRGFQANSRIITTSDTMLEEMINLKR